MPAEFESGFFGGNVPAWHGLGTVIPDDVLDTPAALVAAGLDWTVSERPLYTLDEATGIYAPVPGRKAIIRSTDGAVLGDVGQDYRPVQNAEAFGFVNDLLKTGEAMWHTAGSLMGGARTWMLARVPKTIRVGGSSSEEMLPFLFFANSFDGSLPISVLFTAVRVVCQNTYNQALAGAKNAYRIKHTLGLAPRVDEARRALNIGFTYFDAVETLANRAIMAPFGDTQFMDVLDALMPVPVLKGRAQDNATAERDAVTMIWQSSPSIANIRGTAWGAMNAWTEYVDHHTTGRATHRSTMAENRLKRILFDTSLTDSAVARISELAGISSN
jgi:phage/plasmid-like protein (TIGR03299 family)